jgi:hypothetical protein
MAANAVRLTPNGSDIRRMFLSGKKVAELALELVRDRR